jgi:hypothetical protein
MENLTKNDLSIGKYAGLGLFIVSLADIATFLSGGEERIALIAYIQSLCFATAFWYMRKLLAENNISQFADFNLVLASIIPAAFTVIDLSNPGQLTLSGDQPISTSAGGLYFSITLAIIFLNSKGVLGNIFRYLCVIGATIFFAFGAAQNLFGVELPDTIQILGAVGYLSVVTGVGLGSFMAWNKK